VRWWRLPESEEPRFGSLCKKMNFYNWYYIVRNTRENIRGHRATHLVTLAAAGFSLLLFAVFLLILTNLQLVANRWGSELQITAYLDGDVSEDERQGLGKTIGGWQEVESVSFASPEDALDALKRALGETAHVLDGIPENPLPASMEVRLRKAARNLDSIRTVADRCQSLKGVTQVEYGGDWIGRFFALVRVLRWVGLCLGALLLLGTVIVISSTLTLGFYARRDEIEILRLVGATESFLRLPFLLEALLQGIGGAGVAMALCWGLYLFFQLRLGESWAQLAGWTKPVFLSPVSILALLLLGMVLGIVSTVLSFSRFSRSAP